MVAKRSLGLKIKQTTRLDDIKGAKWKSLSHGFVLYHRPEVKWDSDIFKWILIEIEIRMDFCYS
jgi:hypothetical protein